jgi:hypothetical protein
VTQTAADALTWQSNRPTTPEHIKPYQHYTRQAPGTIARHYGAAMNDVPKDKVFGCKTKASKESAAECMASYPDSEIGKWKLEQSETVYASVRKEPLGRSPSRGYNLPDGLGTTKPAGRCLHVRVRQPARLSWPAHLQTWSCRTAAVNAILQVSCRNSTTLLWTRMLVVLC